MRLFSPCVLAAAVAVPLLAAPAAAAEPPAVTMAEHRVPSTHPGLTLYMREKHLASRTRFAGDRVVLMVHGATYPVEATFDLPVEGSSLMDALARAGYDVFAVDMLGYGRSSRPPEMNQPATANGPVVRTADAARDFGAASAYVRNLRGANAIDILGWSWGTSIAGSYVLGDLGHVHALVQYAPQWVKDPTSTPPPAPLGAYRTVTMEQARERWYNKVPDAARASLIPAGVFEGFWSALMAADPLGATSNPPVVRAPNGITADNYEFWNAGKMLYDPAGITVPALVIHGAWDADLPSYLARAYFERLGTHRKRFVEIGEGTHHVMLEKDHTAFARELIGFLDAP